MGTRTLRGHDAIEYAERHGLTVRKAADPTEGHRNGLTPSEARSIAAEDAGLIYVDLVYCTGCGETVASHAAHWHSGSAYCDGCEHAPSEAS